MEPFSRMVAAVLNCGRAQDKEPVEPDRQEVRQQPKPEEADSWEEIDLTPLPVRTEAGMMMPYGEVGGYGMMGGPAAAMPNWLCLEPMAGIVGVPLGLEVLTMVDAVVVQQLIEYVEMMTGYETANRYIVRTLTGQPFFYAFEESNPNARQWCGSNRSFTMHLVDNFHREVAVIRRPNACCGQSAVIESPPGVFAGRLSQDGGCCGCNFTVYDEVGVPQFKILGPCCVCCCPPREFPIMAYGGNRIGNITKLWAGMAQEMYTDADNFALNFPLNLHPALKVLLIGVCFIIDYEYFEEKGGAGDVGALGGGGGGGYGYGYGY